MINPIKSDVDRESLEPESIGGADSGLSISLPRVRIKEISTTISLNNNVNIQIWVSQQQVPHESPDHIG